MKILFDYHWHPVTLEYICSTKARINPKRPDTFLAPPAQATRKTPPKAAKNKAVRWAGNDWEVVPDKRGQKMHNPTTREETDVDHIGPPPDGWEFGSLPRVLSEEQAKKLNEIKQAVAAASETGFVSNALGSDHTYSYSSRPSAREDLIGAVTADTDLPFLCTDSKGIKAFRLHTAAQLKQVLRDATGIRLGYLQQAEQLIDQAKSASTIAEVDQIAVAIS